MHQTTKCSPVKTGECPRIMKTIASIRGVNVFVDLPLDISNDCLHLEHLTHGAPAAHQHHSKSTLQHANINFVFTDLF